MRISATSDLHGRLPPDVEACDVLLIAGDVCPHVHPVGSSIDRRFQRRWLVDAFLPWIERQPCREWFVTAGNHDFAFEPAAERDALPPDLLRRLLLDRTASVCSAGETIRIHGSPWSLRFGNWAFMANESDIAARLDAVPPRVDVLMVHGPPFGIGDQTVDGTHAGSRSLLAAIESKRPRLSIHGHIHEGSGAEAIVGHGPRATIVRNVAYLDERYDPANPPATFTLSPE